MSQVIASSVPKSRVAKPTPQRMYPFIRNLQPQYIYPMYMYLGKRGNPFGFPTPTYYLVYLLTYLVTKVYTSSLVYLISEALPFLPFAIKPFRV